MSRNILRSSVQIQHVTKCSHSIIFCGRVQLKCDGTRWRKGGEVKGKLANAVGSQYPSHYLGTWCMQHYYTADTHTSAASSRLNWRPNRLKWTRPFRRKTKYSFCACVITFQLASITVYFTLDRKLWQPFNKSAGYLKHIIILPRILARGWF